MPRNIPVDTSRFNLVATGHVTPVVTWVPDPANPGRNMPGPQSTDESGTLLWNVDVLVDEEGQDRAETIGVQVPAAHQPVVTKFRPVTFLGLNVSVGINRTAVQMRQYWTASGVVDQGTAPAPKTTPKFGDGGEKAA